MLHNPSFNRTASNKLAMRQPHLQVIAEHMDKLMARFEAETPKESELPSIKWLIKNNGFGILLHTKALQLFFLQHMSQPQKLPVPTESVPNNLNSLHNFLDVAHPANDRKMMRPVSVFPLTAQELRNATPYMQDPNLQIVTRLLHQSVTSYAKGVSEFVQGRYESYAVKQLCDGLISAIKTQGLWSELMPIIAHTLYEEGRNAPLGSGHDLQQAFNKGLDTAVELNAFSAQLKDEVRRCPFQSPLKHLLNTRVGRDEHNQLVLSETGLPFMAFLYQEQIAPYQSTTPAQTPG